MKHTRSCSRGETGRWSVLGTAVGVKLVDGAYLELQFGVKLADGAYLELQVG